MTPAQFRATLAFLDLNAAEAAHMLGVTKRAIRGWLQPEGTERARAVSPQTERLLWLLVRLKRAGLVEPKVMMAEFTPEWLGE